MVKRKAKKGPLPKKSRIEEDLSDEEGSPGPSSNGKSKDLEDENEQGFLADLKQLFDTTNLYEVLKIDPKSKTKTTAAELKKAYYKASLGCHPDRLAAGADAEQRDWATKKFQALSRVYSILGDEKKRKLYDDTGVIDDENVLGGSEGQDWGAYWRLLFKKITKADLEQFDREYKGSEEEHRDLLSAYNQSKGDMGLILERVMSAQPDDEPRFRQLLQKEIDEGHLTDYAAFSKETEKKRNARRRKAEREAKEAEEMLNSMQQGSSGGDGDLAALILSKQQNRQTQADSFLDGLADKYARKSKQKKTVKK